MISKKTRMRLNYGKNIEFTDVFGYIHFGIITYDSELGTGDSRPPFQVFCQRYQKIQGDLLKCQFCGKDPYNDPAYAYMVKAATVCFEKFISRCQGGA